jgi:hypothetical protein
VADDPGLGEEVALEVGEAERAAAVEVAHGADARGHEQRAVDLGERDRVVQLCVRQPGDVDLDDRADGEQVLDVGAAVVVVEGDRVAAAAEALELADQVGLSRVGGDLQHGAVGAHRRRADLDEEVAGDRDPRRVTAGEGVEADVAERVDQQGGGRLGVTGRVEAASLIVAEEQLVAHDAVAFVGNRLTDDGHVGPPRARIEREAHTRNVGRRAPGLSPRAGNSWSLRERAAVRKP